MMRPGDIRLRQLVCGASILALGVSVAGQAAAQTAPVAEPAEVDEIVVTGFRQSLDAAINVKREAVSSVDVVVAEDIAKFPDQNLAESLQRIPGISIQRDGGEGRAITVRGLSGQFTRVRVNGLEAIATSTDGASPNRERAFDFNVFASELFNSLVVHKTAEASLDEGSLGAVVDLNTGNPLAGKDGLTFVASAQGQYNDLSDDIGPRLAGLVAWRSEDGVFGASLSAAYTQNNTLELGNNTVRWAQARFDSVDGVRCFTTPNSGGTYVPSAGCNAAALAFHPRIPRYGKVGHDRERIGLTGSLQWAPTERTKVSLDGLYSRFRETRTEQWAEVLFRSNERSIDARNLTIDPTTNDIVAGTFDDAWVRTENYLRKSETEFYQFSVNATHEFTDNFRGTLLAGISKSAADIPVETTFVFDDRDAAGYRYDYTDSRSPLLTFGTSVTDPANFQLSELRDRPSNNTNKFKTLSGNVEWDLTDGIQIVAGAVYRRFDFDLEAYTRDTVVCPTRTTAGPDVVLGTITCTPSSVFGANAVYGYRATSALSRTVNLGSAGQPSGTTTTWIVPDIDAAANLTGLYGRTAAIDAGNIRSVREEDTGGFVQGNFKGEIAGLRFAANAGLRYMETDQSSTGLNNGVAVTVKRKYHDWLPAVNLAIFPTEDIIIRAAASEVMTRPNLGNLTPGGTVDGFNYRVNFGNPNLDPFRAKAYDVGLEWYFAPQALASVAFFKKDIQSFPLGVTRTGTFASTGLPTSIINPSSPAASNPEGQAWTISSIENGSGGSLKGVELAIQAPFSFLPGFWANFGGIANATFVDSNVTYRVSGPATTPGGALPGTDVDSTLYGLAKRAYNATLYYEEGKFSARASIAYRSGFVDNASGTGNIFEGYNSSVNVDASVKYRVTEQLELSLEGINLTDDYRDRYVDKEANRAYENNHFGRTIIFGVRYRM
ncbi:MAG: TonB-dependent receptor [Phenylobacterium sp. RIFCSPHIGHO2_01_FULL_69_31]|uniref:TonB-dependent receptor n=1 Tax=Phenylobacterium sp. RIFCSPHIGHO2_01_FULL_69_31 TaxID=1801944 RepID=UPI0008B4FBD7|nr:TonB-dependent receptor [Phenylobacterium sp. RIFCSPHIGHO2_01_FULL_69_31]OHB27948.1 MAG: TonB-dependent receptor [Phenylobacterium sp. RIFCSPHIGHO2_01_FULL_69_31]